MHKLFNNRPLRACGRCNDHVIPTAPWDTFVNGKPACPEAYGLQCRLLHHAAAKQLQLRAEQMEQTTAEERNDAKDTD